MDSKDKILCVVYFVRHGESTGNITQTLLDRYEDLLTENGRKQAELLGKHFSDVSFDRVYSSIYQRASETAEIITKNSKSPHVTVQTDERLREIDYGVIVGKSYKDGLAFVKSLQLPVMEWRFPEGESFRESGDRISRFWKETCSNLMEQRISKIQNVLVVAHSVAITNFFASLPDNEDYTLHNWDPGNDLKVMKNASYMKVEVAVNEKGQIGMTFILKHYTGHFNCEKSEKKDIGINNFVKKADSAKEFSGCVQQ